MDLLRFPFKINVNFHTKSCIGVFSLLFFFFKTGSYIPNQVSQVVLVVKNLSANAGDIEMRVRSLGQEDPMEEGMATPIVFLPGGSQGLRSLAGYSPWG